MGRRRVAVLPEALANQIAAGEVVERPASVVKELVENALDAEASRVFVDVEEGGARLVRVVDDGLGMGREDATLAVQRHATSKIHDAADLAAIGTLGFRGEALPSVASVSRFLLVTRSEEDEVGTEVRVDGGGAPVVRDIGARVGTRIEVRDLFHNVPARLKFLKRTSTELSHIKHLITTFALGYPHVHFRLTHDGRKLMEHPVAPNLKQRIFQVMGKKVADHLYEVRGGRPGAGEPRVRGYISAPALTRSSQKSVHCFINGRWVRDRVVSHALVAAYGNLLPTGSYPYAVLYVHLPPDRVDVNVHPTKAEVRFVSSGEVHEAISRACKLTLSRTPWIQGGRAESYERRREIPAQARQFRGEEAQRPTILPMDSLLGSPAPPPAPGPPATPRPEDRAVDRPRILDFRAEIRPVGDPAREPAVAPQPEPGRALRLLGVASRRYAVAEDALGVRVVDVPKARVATTTRGLRAALAANRVESQHLLIPLQVEIPPEAAQALEAHAELVRRLGFDLESYGGSTWQLCALPQALARAPATSVVEALVAGLLRGRGEDLVLERVARCAAREEDRPDRTEAGALLRALGELEARELDRIAPLHRFQDR